MRWLLLGLVSFYRRILAPHYGGGCRYEPSCSVYAEECLRQHGAIVGVRLTVRRLMRCRPPWPEGYDPPPESSREIADALAGRLVKAAQQLPDSEAVPE